MSENKLYITTMVILLIVILQGLMISYFEKEIDKYESLLLDIRQENARLSYELEATAEELGKVKISAIVTSYAPFDNRSGICADSDPQHTSTGYRPGRTYAAADPSRLLYGTKLWIPDYGVVEVQDTGSALINDKENIRVDIFADTYEEAMEWGKQEIEVIILN